MNYIYIGASNHKYGLVQNALYRDRPAKLIEMLKTNFNLIENLFVPIDEFVDAEKELSKTSSLVAKAFRQVKEAK